MNERNIKKKKLAEPDYDFTLETIEGFPFNHQVFLSNEVLILKCISGTSLISINTQEHEFAAESNFLLAEGMIFKVLECSSDFSMTIFRFSSHFFNAIYPMLPQKAAYVMMHSAPDLYAKEEMELSNSIFMQLCFLYHKKHHTWRHKITVNLIINYILEIYEQTYKFVKGKEQKPSNHRTFLIDRFYRLCIDEHTQHRRLEYYAEKLNITTRYLHKICKNSVHMTPKQCLNYMISGSAKRLLLNTSLTNQQISHELNFPDQTSFGQFFKRNVGMPPSEFRSKFK